MPKICFSIVSAALIAVALAACGGSDDSPSKSDYIAKADAACKSNDAETAKLGEELGTKLNAGDFAGAAAAGQKAFESSQANLDEVKAMDRPEGTDKELEALFASAQLSFDQTKALITAIKTGNVRAIQAAAAKITPLTTATSKLSTAFGFKSCGVETNN